MRTCVDADEAYPVYSVLSSCAGYFHQHIELTEEERADFERVDAEFWAWQERLQEKADARPPT